jgi:uncharacterized damage-inducible protein DinB
MRANSAYPCDELTGGTGHAAVSCAMQAGNTCRRYRGMELMNQEANLEPVMPDTNVAVLSPVNEEILTELGSMVIQFERLMENRSHESLHQPGQDGRWGVVEVLCHLRDWEDVIHDRIWQIVEGEQPEFDDPDVMMWSLERDYGAQDAREVFQELSSRRLSLIERLRETEDVAWERTGVMGGRGEMTLAEFLQHVIEHDRRYLEEAREAAA